MFTCVIPSEKYVQFRVKKHEKTWGGGQRRLYREKANGFRAKKVPFLTPSK